ncbi:hypothetical protein QTJ16_006894 [Diplocarpon rosae]|uniref:2-(3-amino-3-carboxypropyl)histidine synthase subunit 2 n=1 Tax=Diplocarpon rosae TaxID=946125 RepID=A0AAD9SV41_9HELO|nr:hypothetical protein QTJ16_006894 [Diplocarpon rosae]
MSIQTAPPVLSTPESHIFEGPTPVLGREDRPHYTDAQLHEIYEIARTVKEVCEGGHKRIALQFPDSMLRDSVKVFEMLEKGCRDWRWSRKDGEDAEKTAASEEGLEIDINALAVAPSQPKPSSKPYFSILADTSYGSCCVDEIAAQHISATLLVHYGRSCLSPTSRIPVLYVYTSPPLSVSAVRKSFVSLFPDRSQKVLLMADIPYHSHVPVILDALRKDGYTEITAPDVVQEPESVVPNRRVEDRVRETLGEYNLFHVSEPAPALLLTLASRVKEMYIYPTASSASDQNGVVTPQALKQQTSTILRRRYALLTHLSTAPILGILINTLSVSHHLAALATLKSLISRAGKKSYTFVVGKVNAAKLANFSEIGGWVVVGCWESSLVDGEGFYKGVVTPFELGVALKGAGRVWDGSWRGDFGAVTGTEDFTPAGGDINEETLAEGGDADSDSASESEPPEFDLRTGRYISHSRPMRTTRPQTSSPQTFCSPSSNTAASQVLTRRAKGDLATINGAASPGAEFLRSQRTWTGLGSDFAQEDTPLDIEEGRAGVARGYSIAGGERR